MARKKQSDASTAPLDTEQQDPLEGPEKEKDPQGDMERDNLSGGYSGVSAKKSRVETGIDCKPDEFMQETEGAQEGAAATSVGMEIRTQGGSGDGSGATGHEIQNFLNYAGSDDEEEGSGMEDDGGSFGRQSPTSSEKKNSERRR